MDQQKTAPNDDADELAAGSPDERAELRSDSGPLLAPLKFWRDTGRSNTAPQLVELTATIAADK